MSEKVAKILIEKRLQEKGFNISFLDERGAFLSSYLGGNKEDLLKIVKEKNTELNTQFFVYKRDENYILLLSMKHFSSLNQGVGAPGGHDKFEYPFFDDNYMSNFPIHTLKDASAC